MKAGVAPVVMLASGTRGDVQPFLALALGLRRAGIRAVVAAAPRFRSLVECRGMEFAGLEGNPSDLMAGDSRSMPASLRGGALRGAAATIRFLRGAQAEYRRMLESAAAVCSRLRARAVIVGLASTWGLSLAEALGIPAVPCMLQPFGRTRGFPSALFPVRASLGSAYNELSYRVIEQSMWLPWRRTINEWRRRTLGLAALPPAGPWKERYARGFPCLYGFSPAVVPAPSDWPAEHLVTGYWFLDDGPGEEPSPGLERFLSSGPQPLYIGFGSMGMHGGAEALAVIERALESSGLRAVVSPGGITLPPGAHRRIFVAADVPHMWLFPRTAAVMHHGGAGTTAMGLRAGVPSIISPTAADQHFWAERVARIGAGPRPLAPRDLTADTLAKVFSRTVSDEAMRERARLLGERIRAENGVARAVEALLPLLGGTGPASLRDLHRMSS
jgi:sterol 3beta-glucosyltransferase